MQDLQRDSGGRENRGQAKFSSSMQRDNKTLASYLVLAKIPTFPVIYRSRWNHEILEQKGIQGKDTYI